LALSNSINSRKSLPSCIRIEPCLEFKNDRNPLLRGHRKILFDIRGLGCLKATELTDHAFHNLILQVPGLPRGARAIPAAQSLQE